MSGAAAGETVCLTPGLDVADAGAAHWLRQVALRLRREVLWCWHQRGERRCEEGVLPPARDPVMESLDLTRYREEKRWFFTTDVTARFLSDRIAELPAAAAPAAGTWDRACGALKLDEPSRFVLALGLAARLDAAVGPVCAACHNDSSRPYPTLALAQRLWDHPTEVMRGSDPDHPLFRVGLLSAMGGRDGIDWHQPLEMPAAIAHELCRGGASRPAPEDEDPTASPHRLIDDASWQLLATPPAAMQVVLLGGPPGADFEGTARLLARRCGMGLTVVREQVQPDRQHLVTLAATCWLAGRHLLLAEDWIDRASQTPGSPWYAPLASIPARWFLPVIEGSAPSIPAPLLAARLAVPALDHAGRVTLLGAALGDGAAALRPAIREAARRFRFETRAIQRVVAAVKALPRAAEPTDLFAACRNQVPASLGHLAQEVRPRFRLADVVLPSDPAEHLREIARAMQALTEVHYEWGAARPWNESGLAVAFCGPPGCGKSMSAEALAHELEMPLYRIDLSQVVDKYIGETEKRIKRLCDAADSSDCILLFDEADALFGKRTEVRDSHDRFANIEVSYLLDRMERFKGLAILSTNRRKDLDEAFLRRLRYIVEFPVPGREERQRIWREVFPEGADLSDLDLRFLADRFEISGGYIRSAAFNACLQCAGDLGDGSRRVTMKAMVRALRRELEKMGRKVGGDEFGRYQTLLKEGP